MDIIELAEQNQQNAWKLLDETGIIPAWERIGATVHLVGSLKSGLLMKSRDIDLHIYTGKLGRIRILHKTFHFLNSCIGNLMRTPHTLVPQIGIPRPFQ